MRSLGIRLPLLVVSVCMGWGLSVWAMDLRYGETVYLFPTTTTVRGASAYVETSSVATGSYLMPAALVVPSYYPTAYFADEVVLSPTTYVETRYRRGLLGRLFGRDRLVERSVVAGYPAYVPTSLLVPSYYPTTYSLTRDYIPTVFDSRVTYETAYATSPASPCEEVVSTWSVPVREAPYLKGAGVPTGSGSKQVESKAADESTISSDVGPAPGADSAVQNSGATGDTTKAASEADSPPKPPIPEKTKDADDAASGGAVQAQEKAISKEAPAKKAVTKDAAVKNKEAGTPKAAGETTPKQPVPPKLPTGDKEDTPLELAPGANNAGVGRYEVRKPVIPTTVIRAERRNVLFGRVESSTGGQPEEEVRVIVSSRSNQAVRHEGMSDAYGRFAIKLTDGDWTVNVTMRSGRIYPVSQISVSGGRIYDEREGREVPSLIISR